VAYANLQQTALDWDALRQEFRKFLMEEKPLKDKVETDFDVITTKGTDIPLEKIQQYTKRLGISHGSTPDGEVFINGKPVEMSGVRHTDPFLPHGYFAQYHFVANLTTSASRNRIPDPVYSRAGASLTTGTFTSHPQSFSFIWALSRMISPTFQFISMTFQGAIGAGTNWFTRLAR
jgi:hypothetical protein